MEVNVDMLMGELNCRKTFKEMRQASIEASNVYQEELKQKIQEARAQRDSLSH